jgi:1-deoxy-D-xylulose-5-phosphate reductoisomerase
MKKRIAILGITGSIGTSTIEIVRHHNDRFEIVFASANTDYQKLLSIATEFRIPTIAISDSSITVNHTFETIKFYQGSADILNWIENEEYDILINAVTGSAGLPYTMSTLKTGRVLALANKESLVMAGHLIPNFTNIIPIDSEHSAIFQVLSGKKVDQVKRLHITASGGAFRTTPLSELPSVNLKQTLKHPTWDMGVKVTIDSATMMNKGLEVIEAHWLFGIDYDNIRGVIHPQSVIHSIVEFLDGSMIAQMSVPTMQLPIMYALTHPEHIQSDKVVTELVSLPSLTFDEICPKRYPLYYIANAAARAGGIMPTVLNAANERAIELFVKSQIRFVDIADFVEKTLNSYENISNPDLETILRINSEI